MKKEKKYQIKDLPADFNLTGCLLNERKIVSGWNKGFWLDTEEKGRVEPIFFKTFEEIKNWEIEVPVDRVLEIELKNKTLYKEELIRKFKAEK